MWSGSASAIPDDWALCNGANGTPNLVNKFIRGGNSAGGTGGNDSVTLSANNLPAHTHPLSGSIDVTADVMSATTNSDADQSLYSQATSPRLLVYTKNTRFSIMLSGNTGNNTTTATAVDNKPAYYTLCFIMKIQ
jgi:microcystin-dependent protein